MKDIMGMMKQVGQMQARLKEMQDELAKAEHEGQSGGGLVHLTVDGKGEVKRVRIDPSLMKPDEVEISKPVGALTVMLFVRETAGIEKLVVAEAVPWVVVNAASVSVVESGPVVEMVVGSGAKVMPLKIFELLAVRSVVGALSLIVAL